MGTKEVEDRRKSESSATSGGKWRKIGPDTSPSRDRTYSQKSDLTNGEKSFENEKNESSGEEQEQKNEESAENGNGSRSRSRSKSGEDSSDDEDALTALRQAALGSLGKFKKTENDRESESDEEDL